MDNRSLESGASATPPAPPATPSIGYPQKGNPTTGTPASKGGVFWHYQIGEELRYVLSQAGLTPTIADLTQIYQAIEILIGRRVGDYALDTGTANAKVVALSPALAAYTTNFDGSFKVAVTNTGACTVNFGPGPVPLVRDDGAALAGGDTVAGMIVFYDYVQADGKAYITSMVQSQGDARYLLQTNPSTGLVETFAPPGGAMNRRYVDVVNITGMQYNAVNVNAEYMTVNNAAYNTGTNAWAGRDAAGACFAEVMTDAGQKLYYYAATAAAGVAPTWTLMFGFDLAAGNFVGTVTPLGYGQSWQSMTGSRAFGTVYTNTTSKPILVSCTVTSATSAILTATGTCNSVTVDYIYLAANASAQAGAIKFLVPPGGTYSISSSNNLTSWIEFR